MDELRIALTLGALALLGCTGGACPSSPGLGWVSPTDGATLGAADDEDLNEPGIQHTLEVEGCGLEDGQALELRIEEPFETTYATGVLRDGRWRVQVPLIVGDVRLRARRADGSVESDPLRLRVTLD
ncbi:MAG TPA: hypothetical protein RMH99_27695 [Sandaracinaceae bacterium LLY-WYZ-13_1]|nr:hypothetical protein [Sandaracinaceae bacterium LLY-WYZ-13_1]